MQRAWGGLAGIFLNGVCSVRAGGRVPDRRVRVSGDDVDFGRIAQTVARRPAARNRAGAAAIGRTGGIGFDQNIRDIVERCHSAVTFLINPGYGGPDAASFVLA